MSGLSVVETGMVEQHGERMTIQTTTVLEFE
jgi:hypothetical protein